MSESGGSSPIGSGDGGRHTADGWGSASAASGASAETARHSATGTTAFPPLGADRSEGPGGVATAHSGGASGDASPVVSPSLRRGPMQTVVVLRRIDPWSAFTTMLGLTFAMYLVWMVAVGSVYLLLSGMGVWDRLGGLLSGVAGDDSASAVGASTIFLYAGGVGLLNVLLISVLTALGVFIYNLTAGLTGGGVQVTLADRRR